MESTNPYRCYLSRLPNLFPPAVLILTAMPFKQKALTELGSVVHWSVEWWTRIRHGTMQYGCHSCDGVCGVGNPGASSFRTHSTISGVVFAPLDRKIRSRRNRYSGIPPFSLDFRLRVLSISVSIAPSPPRPLESSASRKYFLNNSRSMWIFKWSLTGTIVLLAISTHGFQPCCGAILN